MIYQSPRKYYFRGLCVHLLMHKIIDRNYKFSSFVPLLSLKILGRCQAEVFLKSPCEIGSVVVCTECSDFRNVQFRVDIQQMTGTLHTYVDNEVLRFFTCYIVQSLT